MTAIKMTVMQNLKPHKRLTGQKWRAGDLYDSWNQLQKDHYDGIIDLYAPITEDGRDSMPSVAQQWKDAYKWRNHK